MGKPFISLEKAIDILTLLESAHKELSAQEFSEQLGIPLSTTYKYLEIFLKKKFIYKDMRTKKISFGLTIFKMGNQAAEKFSIRNIALPFMHTLAQRSKETVTLTIVYGMDAINLETVESPRRVSLTIKKRSRAPFHAGASQKILLAYQDETFVDAVIKERGIEKLNKNTITDPDRLKKELEIIRNDGFSQSDSEVDSGVGSVAAPIFDHNGRLAAGITIIGPADRILGGNREKLIGMVTESAKTVSLELIKAKGPRPSPPFEFASSL